MRTKSRREIRMLLALFSLVVWGIPARADAHLMNTGFGPFYDGLIHLFVTPVDLLQVIAIGLLAGLRGPGFGRAVLFALPVAWLAGSISGLLIGTHVTLPAVTAVAIIVLGGLVAADKPLSLATITGMAIVIGILNGTLNGIEFAQAQSSGLVVVGIACALFVVVSLVSGQAASVRALWSRIAMRVTGSWIAASGLFMLGWTMRGVN